MLFRLSKLFKMDIFSKDENSIELISYQEKKESNPLFVSTKLRDVLMEKAKMQEVPVIYKDKNSVYFICIFYKGIYYFSGYVTLGDLDRVALHKVYQEYGIHEIFEKRIRNISFSELVDITGVLGEYITGKKYSDQELIAGNYLVMDTVVEKEEILFKLKKEEEEEYHHTYVEEYQLLECIREGRVQEAIQRMRSLDVELGRMSSKEIRHWKNAAIVGITLCTRAAIEGGISPGEGYQISDFYIQKCDGSTEIPQIMEYRNLAIEKLANEVNKRLQKKHSSRYVECCKDYVLKNYKEKVYLEEVAAGLGISSSYLSRLFHKETGIRFQDYVNKVRVERAANLLRYSEEPIARIAEYVNFPSQSYFGRVFKEQMHMTPRVYREVNKPIEF